MVLIGDALLISLSIFFYGNGISSVVGLHQCARFEVGTRKCVSYPRKHPESGIEYEWATCMTKEDVVKIRPKTPFPGSPNLVDCDNTFHSCWYRCSFDHGYQLVDACKCKDPRICPYADYDHPYPSSGPVGGFKQTSFGTRVCLRHPDRTRYTDKWEWNYCFNRWTAPTYHSRCFKTWDNCLEECSILKQNGAKGMPESCECKPGEDDETTTLRPTAQPATTLTTTPTTTLPPWCFNPTGESCNWYEECLEKRFPCQHTLADYAIKYAMHFCNAYNQNYQRFSSIGRNWVDATRKCLHQELVPFLNRDDSQITTCKEIQETAFESHNCCYTAGTKCTTEKRPSICDIPCEDWFHVFWTIKEAFVGDAVYESLAGLWYVAKSCSSDPDSDVTFDCFSKFGPIMFPWVRVGLFVVRITKSYFDRKRRSVSGSRITDNDQIAIKILSTVSEQLGWDKKKIDWFVYSDHKALSEDEELNVNFVIIDKTERISSNITYSNLLNTTMSTMMKSLQNGEIHMQSEVNGNKVRLTSALECLTTECKNITISVDIPSISIRIGSMNVIIVSVLAINLLFRINILE